MQIGKSEIKSLISRVSYIASSTELEEASSKYHIRGAWIAIIFDPLFAITDYFNIPNGWHQILFIRLAIAAITLATILLRKRYQLPSFIVVMVPVLLISLQNAYTYSLVDNDDLLGHNINYMALLIAGGMFVLWRLLYSLGIIAISGIATTYFITNNPHLDISQFFVKGGLLLLASGIFMIILIKARYSLTVKEIKARLALKTANSELEKSNEELEKQKVLVEDKNQKITDSIRYAQRIQKSILGEQSRIDTWFSDSFVFFKPKDILSGDFYWFHEDENAKIIIAADCTGHGVPAALMTVMGNSILNEIVSQRKIYEPDKILYELDNRIIESFSHENTDNQKINDGMDVSIISFIREEIYFSAAKNPIYIMKNEEEILIPGSKFPIGSTQYKMDKVFEKHTLHVDKGDKLYIYSDGFQDQFGGDTNRKYLSKRFKDFLKKTSTISMKDQKEKLEQELENWKGKNRQTDDILIIGVEI